MEAGKLIGTLVSLHVIKSLSYAGTNGRCQLISMRFGEKHRYLCRRLLLPVFTWRLFKCYAFITRERQPCFEIVI